MAVVVWTRMSSTGSEIFEHLSSIGNSLGRLRLDYTTGGVMSLGIDFDFKSLMSPAMLCLLCAWGEDVSS